MSLLVKPALPLTNCMTWATHLTVQRLFIILSHGNHVTCLIDVERIEVEDRSVTSCAHSVPSQEDHIIWSDNGSVGSQGRGPLTA